MSRLRTFWQKRPRPSRPFTPILPNPYIVANPIRTREMFYGREDDFTFVRQRLETETQGVIVVFVGERRCGKSSILYQMLGGRLGDGFLPVMVDMQYMAALAKNDGEFYTHFARLICSALNHEALHAERYDFERQEAQAFEQLIDEIQRLYAGKKLVFLIDEYEWLEEKITSGAWSGGVLLFMASLLERKGVSFIFTGSSRLQEQRAETWKVMMGKAVHRRVSFLTPDDTIRLITEPVAGRVEYDTGLPEAILRLTAGHPFYAQVLCQNMVDHLNVEEKNLATGEDLKQVVEGEIENPKPQMLFAWEVFSGQEKLVLSLMAELLRHEGDRVSARQMTQAIVQHEYPVDLNENTVHVTLERLFEREVVEKRRDTYWFRMDLLRQWIARARSIWQVMSELGLVSVGPVTAATQAPSRRRRMVVLPGLAVIVLLGILGWYALQQPSRKEEAKLSSSSTLAMLRIESTPAGAEIFLAGDSLSRGVTPFILTDLSPGQHRVTLRKAGYAPVIDSMEVAAGQVGTLTLSLVQQRGRLSIRSDPPGAEVYLDGETKSRGTTPQEVDLAAGIHALSLAKSGYPTMTSQVEVMADRSVERVVKLLKQVGGVAIRSEPDGAQVYLDDEPGARGVTPLTLEQLAPGPHTLRLRREGYGEARQSLTVTANTITPLALIRLPRDLGRLTVISTPVGDVYLDGDKLGQTPYEITNAVPGPHRLRVARAGYAPSERTVTIAAGDNPLVTVTLERQYGNLELIVRPWGYVFIDDERKGASPPWIREVLGVGPHTIRMTNPEYQDSVFTISIPQGETIQYTIKLTNRKP